MKAAKAFPSPRPGAGARFVWWAAASLSLHGLALVWIISLGGAERLVTVSNLRVRLVDAQSEHAAAQPAPQAPRPTRPPSPPPARQAPPRAPSVESTSPVIGRGELTAGPPVAASQVSIAPRPVESSSSSHETIGPDSGGEARRREEQALAAPSSPGTGDEGPAVGDHGGTGSPSHAGQVGIAFLSKRDESGSGHTGGGMAARGDGSGAGPAGDWTGASVRGGGGSGTGMGAGAGAGLLQSIRARIERAKIYPEAARHEGVQGTVELRFRIAADGSVEAVEIVRSSGSGILDEASQETIRRAGPYPLVRGWIRLPLAYRLDQ